MVSAHDNTPLQVKTPLELNNDMLLARGLNNGLHKDLNNCLDNIVSLNYAGNVTAKLLIVDVPPDTKSRSFTITSAPLPAKPTVRL